MRIAIVDDEPLARERLKRLLQELPGYQLVGEAGGGEAALRMIDDEEPDVVLLDIRMDEVDGLQVARQLAAYDPPPAIVFTTAYPEHALSAFDAQAAAYLLKPVRLEKLRDALLRLRRQHRAQTASSAAPQQQAGFITASSREGLRRIPVSDIVYFLADQKYTTVHHLHGEDLIELPLKDLETELGDGFLRVHRKALVATQFIVALERGREGDEGHLLRLRHASELVPVARRRVAEVRRFLSGQKA